MYKLELPSSVRLHPMFHVNNLRPSPTTTLRPFVFVTTHEDDGGGYGLDCISAVRIENLLGRRGKWMLFYIDFRNEHIPPFWHRLNEVRRTIALQSFLDSLVRLDFASRLEFLDFKRTARQDTWRYYPTRNDFSSGA
jgi:hypothetical protein